MDTFVPVPLGIVSNASDKVNKAIEAAKNAGVAEKGEAELTHHIKISTRGLSQAEHNRLVEEFVKPALK